jgi:hypothetical protein
MGVISEPNVHRVQQHPQISGLKCEVFTFRGKNVVIIPKLIRMFKYLIYEKFQTATKWSNFLWGGPTSGVVLLRGSILHLIQESMIHHKVVTCRNTRLRRHRTPYCHIGWSSTIIIPNVSLWLLHQSGFIDCNIQNTPLAKFKNTLSIPSG